MKKLTPFLFFLTTAIAFAQSPWTQEKGKAYTQVSFTTIPSYNSIYGNPNYSILGNLTDKLPALQAGEALLIGESVSIPSIVKIDMCNPNPSSNDIPYWELWKKEWIDADIKEIESEWYS